MTSVTRLGTLEELLEKQNDLIRDLTVRARQLILDADPDTTEVPRVKEGAVAYGHGPKKMSEAYAYLAPFKTHLNVGFYHATALPDPTGLLEGTGASLRHVKIRTQQDLEKPQLRALLEAAIQERRDALASHVWP